VGRSIGVTRTLAPSPAFMPWPRLVRAEREGWARTARKPLKLLASRGERRPERRGYSRWYFGICRALREIVRK